MLNVQTDRWDSLWLIISMSGDVFKCRYGDKWHLELPAERPHHVLEESAKKFKMLFLERVFKFSKFSLLLPEGVSCLNIKYPHGSYNIPGEVVIISRKKKNIPLKKVHLGHFRRLRRVSRCFSGFGHLDTGKGMRRWKAKIREKQPLPTFFHRAALSWVWKVGKSNFLLVFLSLFKQQGGRAHLNSASGLKCVWTQRGHGLMLLLWWWKRILYFAPPGFPSIFWLCKSMSWYF